MQTIDKLLIGFIALCGAGMLLLAGCSLHVPPDGDVPQLQPPEPVCTPVENLDTPQQRLAKCASLVFAFEPQCGVFQPEPTNPTMFWSYCAGAYVITDKGTVFEDTTEIGAITLEDCPEDLPTHRLCYAP